MLAAAPRDGEFFAAPPGEQIKPLLQELLLALIGFTGDVFLDDEGDAEEIKQPASAPFTLAEDVPCVSPSERCAHCADLYFGLDARRRCWR